MGRAVRLGLGLALVVGMTVAAASDEKIGKGVTLTEVTSIRALYETPEKFVGKTIRIDGVVTGVCEEMGCWMALGSTDKPEETVRLKVDHETGIVFPIKAKGKAASAEGVFEKIAAKDTESKNAANEHAAHQAKQAPPTQQAQQSHAGHAGHQATMTPAEFGKAYHIKATGAVIR